MSQPSGYPLHYHTAKPAAVNPSPPHHPAHGIDPSTAGTPNKLPGSRSRLLCTGNLPCEEKDGVLHLLFAHYPPLTHTTMYRTDCWKKTLLSSSSNARCRSYQTTWGDTSTYIVLLHATVRCPWGDNLFSFSRRLILFPSDGLDEHTYGPCQIMFGTLYLVHLGPRIRRTILGTAQHSTNPVRSWENTHMDA